jgi:adenine phosphoribosyltransferase
MVDELYERYKDKGITKVVGIESRGFVLGGALAYRLGAGFVMCRKPGKLPAETLKESYEKEYGIDTIEIHKDAIDENDVVLLHDDLLATGGSMKAAYNLVQHFHPKKTYINFIIELKIEGLDGRAVFDDSTEVDTLLTID